MTAPQVITTLNSLLAEEQRCAVPPLVASTTFVPREAAKDWDRLRDLSRASERNTATLTDLILSLDGIPRPRVTDVHSAEYYFQDIRYLLPRLITGYQGLVRHYQSLAPALAREPKAAELIPRIIARYEQILDR